MNIGGQNGRLSLTAARPIWRRMTDRTPPTDTLDQTLAELA